MTPSQYIKGRQTSIYVHPKSKFGRLLRQAAALMPSVQTGRTGWVKEVIEAALRAYIDSRTPVVPPETEVNHDAC